MVEKPFLSNNSILQPPLPILKEKSGFFSNKPNIFSTKTQISHLCEKPYYFNRIPWQICCNLVIKNFQIQNFPGILGGQLAGKR